MRGNAVRRSHCGSNVFGSPTPFLASLLCLPLQCFAGGSPPPHRRHPKQDRSPGDRFVLPVAYNYVAPDFAEDQPNACTLRVTNRSFVFCNKQKLSVSSSDMCKWSCCCSSSTPKEWIQNSQHNIVCAEEAMQVSQQIREDTSLRRAQVH